MTAPSKQHLDALSRFANRYADDAAKVIARGDDSLSVYARNLVLSTLTELFRWEYPATKWASGELISIGPYGVSDGVQRSSERNEHNHLLVALLDDLKDHLDPWLAAHIDFLASVVQDHAQGELQELADLDRCIDRCDFRTLHIHTHLAEHLLEQAGLVRGQVAVARLNDGLGQIETVVTTESDTGL
jgi:hypothetical protein